MKNYYEILEIDKNASQEVIDKAYKVLVKKYHPDLQTSPDAKSKCEEKIKEINEAYDTINNPDLRAEYDNKLAQESQTVYEEPSRPSDNSNSTRQYYEYKKQEELKRQEQEREQVQERQNQQQQQQYQQQQEQQKQYQDAIRKAYHDAYIQDLKNRGYKIRYKKTLNDYLRSAIALLITIGIIVLILQLPFVKNYLHQLYKDNAVIRAITDTFANLFR